MDLFLYVAFIAGILSAIIITIGYRRDDWMIQSMGLVLLIVTLLFIFLYKPEYANVFSGLAAIIVAIGAFYAVEESRRLRRETVNKENRDRTERLCDEVLKWTIDVLRAYTSLSQICLVLYVDECPHVENEESRLNELCNSHLLNSFQALRDEGKYITKIAPRIGVSTEKNTNDLWQLLTDLINLLDNIRIGLEIDASVPSIVDIDKLIDRIAPLCNEIISEAADAKLRISTAK